MTGKPRPPPRRVRLRLLVLLWVWALLVFTVLDLFLDVRELDRVRPDHALYLGMRTAAHRMVGTPCGEPVDHLRATLRPGAGASAEALVGGGPASIRGRLLRECGAPLRTYELCAREDPARPRRDDPGWRTWTRPDGRFVIRGLREGIHRVWCRTRRGEILCIARVPATVGEEPLHIAIADDWQAR